MEMFLVTQGCSNVSRIAVGFRSKSPSGRPRQAMLLASEQVACQVVLAGELDVGKVSPTARWLEVWNCERHYVIWLFQLNAAAYASISLLLRRWRGSEQQFHLGATGPKWCLFERQLSFFLSSPLRMAFGLETDTLWTHTKYTNYHRNLFLLCCQSLGDDSWLSTHWRHR